MKKTILLLAFVLFAASFAWSQNVRNSGAYYCSQKKSTLSQESLSFLKEAMIVAPHTFDVLSYTLSLKTYNSFFSPYPKNFQATNIVQVKVDSTLNSIKLNAVNASIGIDAVSMAGVSFTQINDTLTINLNRTYNPGEIFSVKINYHHNDIVDGAYYASGGWVFTDCEPEGARRWFPCWDKPSDKAFVDLTVKVPATARCGSNGALIDSTLSGDTLTYHWASAQPVATYLTVMTGKINYDLDIVWWHKISNPNDSIPLRFYFNAGENPSYIESIMPDMTTYYSQNYCEHPFQKNGFATLNSDFIWGGMENQTLTSLCPGCWYESIISHEFAHQWYGDMITCGTWADIWLNEGFATWSEAFWIEKNQGYSGYLNTIHSDASGYISNNPGWAIVVPDWAINTPPVNILFNFEITYEKAACALHQIRYMLGDSLFFLTLQTYCADTNLKFKSSTTPDFNAEVNAVTGLNYDWYFTDWLYQPNHPVYQNQYNIDSIGNGLWNVNFMASQIQTDPAFFRMLLNVKIWFEDSSDTIIRFMNDYDNQTYTWTFNKRPVMFKFDPDDQIVLKEGSTVLGIPEQVKMQGFQLFQNIPNPAGANTKIVFELKNDTQVRIDITDISGKLITRPVDEYATAGKHSIDVNCTSFAPGVYYYTMKAGGFSQTRKMVIVQ